MYSTTRRLLLLPAFAAATALALAACSGESTGPTIQPPMSQSDANAAADVVVGDLSDQADGATTTSSGASFSLVAAPSGGLSQSVTAEAPWYSTACSPPPTVTTNGNTTTYAFDHCAISRLIPLETLTRTGEVDVTLDPGSRLVAFKSFQRTWERIPFRTGQSITTSATQDGTRSIAGDGTTLEFHAYGSGAPATPGSTTASSRDAAPSTCPTRTCQAGSSSI